jgi:hypothetical protein
MPCVLAADASGKIEEAVAVHVFDHRTFGASRKNLRGMRDAARNSSVATAHQFL